MTKKSATPPAVLRPEETMVVPELGGRVTVKAFMLRNRMDFLTNKEDPYAAYARALHDCVFSETGAPLYSIHEWEQFGAKHLGVSLDLLKKARDLVGSEDEGAEPKN